MPGQKPAYALDESRARALWLHAQRLDSEAPFGRGPAATLAAVEQLGYVQIDTIHVIERCHHHILYTRKPSKRALQLAFYRGIVTVGQRAGMLKTYDLARRHFGLAAPAQERHGAGARHGPSHRVSRLGRDRYALAHTLSRNGAEPSRASTRRSHARGVLD
jgi:uncharacterized protein YcaQ